MNKTISINLGGRNFFIEEDAYQKLDAYLKAIKQRFDQYPGSSEIVADMEARIGEKFSEKNQNNSQAVITNSDVDSLISELGSVEDIAGEAGPKNNNYNKNDNNKDSFAPKRLMRNGDDKIIAGVCSGLAAYFNADPFIFRLVFGILFFAWGAIIPIYFVLWLIMPEAKTASEKMQMRGQEFNLDSINATIKERAEEFKTHVNSVKKNEEWKKWSGDVKEKAQSMGQEMGQAGRRLGEELGQASKRSSRGFNDFFRNIARVLGIVISFIFRLVLKIVSLAIIIAFAAAIVGLTVAVAVAAFNINSPYVGLPLSGISHNPAFYVLLFSAYLIVLVPLQMLLILATSAFSGRKVLSGAAAFAMFGVWFLAVITGAALGGRYVPEYIDQIKNSPELQTVSKTFEAKDFNKLALFNSVKYKLIQGDEFKVQAVGYQKDLDRLTVNISEKTLFVRTNSKNFCIFCLNNSPTVQITAPNFYSITLANSASLASDKIIATTTNISLVNSSDADLTIEAENLNILLQNSSDARISGVVHNLSATLKNSSNLRAEALLVKNAKIETKNSSEARVNAEDILEYNMQNSSDIYYLGMPKISGNRENNEDGPKPLY